MKKSIFYFLLGAFMVSTIAFVDVNNSNAETEAYIVLLNSNKDYTLELMKAMPADKYTFRPHDSIRSFGEQMAHLGMSTKFLTKMFIKGDAMPTQEDLMKFGKMEKDMAISKEAVTKAVNEGFDEMIATYQSMNAETMKEKFTVFFDPKQPQFSKELGFKFINDHIIHHRSQALIALRMQGIKAPNYRLY